MFLHCAHFKLREVESFRLQLCPQKRCSHHENLVRKIKLFFRSSPPCRPVSMTAGSNWPRQSSCRRLLDRDRLAGPSGRYLALLDVSKKRPRTCLARVPDLCEMQMGLCLPRAQVLCSHFRLQNVLPLVPDILIIASGFTRYAFLTGLHRNSPRPPLSQARGFGRKPRQHRCSSADAALQR